jgi:hypothetical protein
MEEYKGYSESNLLLFNGTNVVVGGKLMDAEKHYSTCAM